MDDQLEKNIWKTTYHTSYPYLYAFFLPVLIMAIAYAWFGLHPFGPRSIMVLDMYGQYIDYFSNFRQIIVSDQSFFYSWSRNLGGEMMGLTAYYVSSPYSLITVLFPRDHVIDALYFMTLIKIGSLGLTMAIYLRKAKAMQKLPAILFATLYALSGYAVVQAMNIMWLDCLILLPLIALGIERLCKYGRYKLLLAVLPVLFISNFYIAYMTGIFAFIYFVYVFFVHYEWNQWRLFASKLGLFMACAVIGAAMSMFLILPTYFGMQMGKLGFSVTDLSFRSTHDFFDFLPMFMPGAYDTVRNEGLPFIYTGMMMWFLIPLYFLNKNIERKRKILTAVVFWVLFLSMAINTIDIAWHVFKTPNWLPHRYSFLVSFFMVVIAAEAFQKLERSKKSALFYVYAASVVIIFLIQKFDYDFIKAEVHILFALITLGVYLLLLVWIRSNRKTVQALIAILLVVTVELGLNAGFSIYALHVDVVYSTRASYVDFVRETRPVVEAVQRQDKDFYRMGTTFRRSTNDPLSLGYYGLAHSSSTLNTNVLGYMKDMGICVCGHWARYYGSTPVFDSLFAFRYVLAKDHFTFDYYEPMTLLESPIRVYKNPYALPIAYAVHENTEDVFLYGDDAMQRQNRLLGAMLGQRDVEYFKRIRDVQPVLMNLKPRAFRYAHDVYERADSSFSASLDWMIKSVPGKPMFAHFPTHYRNEVHLQLDDQDFGTYFGNDTHGVLSLGTFDHDETIVLSMRLTQEDVLFKNSFFYYLDMEPFVQAVETLSEHALQVNKHTQTRIEGTIVIPKEKTFLFTTIPYEKGWRITANGERVEPIATFDTFLGAKLQPGQYDMVFSFVPQGFREGTIISIMGTLFFAGMMIKKKETRIRKRRKNDEKADATSQKLSRATDGGDADMGT